VEATRSALREGILPGGGTSLIRAAEAVEALQLVGDEAFGARIVLDALHSPLRWIAENAGFEGGPIVEHVASELDYGFDAQSGEYVDLFKAGIVDAARVVRRALESASSVTATMLTTAAAVVEKPKPRSPEEEHAHQHMVC
jgi:chaperonin GroEL